MKNPFIIQRPHITEKATDLEKIGRYVFMVAPSATKNEIKKAVKEIYKVDAVKVRTIVRPTRTKRFMNRRGTDQGYKKAIVELKPGQKIDLT
jgi:large subunit ribosomal protein L23